MRRLLVPVLLAAAVAGCGTTVPLSQQSAAGPADGLDGPAHVGEGTSGAPGGQGATGSPASNVNGPVGASSQGGDGTTGTTGQASGSVGTSQAPLSTRTAASGPLRIGIAYVDPGAAAAAAAIGAKGASVGDPKGYAQALIADLNARGGVNGRKLVATFYADDVTGDSQGAQMTTACEQFMTDDKAFGVIGIGIPELATCVHRRGGVQVDASFGVSSLTDAAFRGLPSYVNVTAVSLDRAAATLVKGLIAEGYFSAWDTRKGAAASEPAAAPVKVGVISYDTPYFKEAIEKVLKPALARAGHPAVVTTYVNHHQSLSDLSAQTGQTSSAVLQMAGNGITHVIDFDDNGTIGLTFMSNAESQGYRPRYGVTSGSEANYLVTSGTVPAAQFGGALGIGWASLLDVPVTDWLKGANTARKHCAAVLPGRGRLQAATGLRSSRCGRDVRRPQRAHLRDRSSRPEPEPGELQPSSPNAGQQLPKRVYSRHPADLRAAGRRRLLPTVGVLPAVPLHDLHLRPSGVVSRNLEVHQVGDLTGTPVLYLHGSGSSRLEADVYTAAAQALGVRLTAWDRPGAGMSPHYDGRQLNHVIDDARQVLADLDLRTARAAIGLSGGGTHVLALAALAPDLAERYVAINPGGPASEEALAKLPRRMRLLVSSARRRPWLFRQLARPMERMGSDLEKTLESRLRSAAMDPHDLAVLRNPRIVAPFAAASREGARQPGAWLTEARMLWAQDWPFNPHAAQAELHVFSGEDDPFRSFAEDLATSGAHLHSFPGGHVSGFAPDVLREVLLTALNG